MSCTEADTIKDRIARFKEIFRPKTDENHDYSFKRPKIKPKKPKKKPKPVKEDNSKNLEPNNRTLKRENYEKDKIISMMESEIGILYDQIKLMVKYL